VRHVVAHFRGGLVEPHEGGEVRRPRPRLAAFPSVDDAGGDAKLARYLEDSKAREDAERQQDAVKHGLVYHAPRSIAN